MEQERKTTSGFFRRLRRYQADENDATGLFRKFNFTDNVNLCYYGSKNPVWKPHPFAFNY